MSIGRGRVAGNRALSDKGHDDGRERSCTGVGGRLIIGELISMGTRDGPYVVFFRVVVKCTISSCGGQPVH